MAPTGLRTKERARSSQPSGLEPLLDHLPQGSPPAELEVLEKDETEEKLEKLLFGDDAGFLELLKTRPADQQLIVGAGVSGKEVQEDDGEGDLEIVADENVRTQVGQVEKISRLIRFF